MMQCKVMCLAAVAAVAVAGVAMACPMERAVYVEPETGAKLHFRAAESWEQAGMTKHVMDLDLPDGRKLWGVIGENMGTSRDTGNLFLGCERPGPDSTLPTEAEMAECRVWSGVVYALAGSRIADTPYPQDEAPPALILSDVGRQLRYAVMDGPQDAMWDQFNLESCTE